MIGENIALGIIPVGSGNGLARHLQIPLNPAKALDVIRQFQPKTIDTVSVNQSDVFLATAGMGFDAYIAAKFQTYGKRGFWSYVKLVLQEWLFYEPELYELIVDGQILQVEAFLIAIANISQYGLNAKIAPSAQINDGWLDLIILKKFPARAAPRLVYQLFNGSINQSPYVQIIKCKFIQLKQPFCALHLDGEPTLFRHGLQIRINPSALNILVP